MSDEPRDLVLTYVVDQSGVGIDHDETPTNAAILEALKKNYRIIDVISTPFASHVAVTVIMTRIAPEADTQATRYKK